MSEETIQDEATATAEGTEATGADAEEKAVGTEAPTENTVPAAAEATEPSDAAAENAAENKAEEKVEAEAPPVQHPPTDRPFLLVTALVDSGARAATATLSHGDAMERAVKAAEEAGLAGLDLVELPISPAPFGALRKALSLADDTVALYDLFPLASHLSPEVRKVAGQFLAAEAVWTLEDQGLLGGVPLNARLDLPKGWERDPKAVHTRLVQAGALNLSDQGIETFKTVKAAWDTSA